MKHFLKLTWTSYSVIYFINEDRKRNCLKYQFCLFSVSVNVKQRARPFYHELINSFVIESFSISDPFLSIPAGVTSSTHHVDRKILVAHDRNSIHKSLKYFFLI